MTKMRYLPKKILLIKNKAIAIRRGLTLVEMIIAMSLMTIVFASIIPVFGLISDSWDSKQAAADVMQNGRILIDHIQRNLSQAVKIVAVSDSSEADEI